MLDHLSFQCHLIYHGFLEIIYCMALSTKLSRAILCSTIYLEISIYNFLPSHHQYITKGIPISPKRKSLAAKFLTTELICWNLPVSSFDDDTYKTNPFPRRQATPINRHKTSENQNAISLACG